MSRISVLGLGAMGSAVAAAYLSRGFEVTVWNRTAARAAPLIEQGARSAAAPADAIAASPLTLVSVLDYPAVRDVLETAVGALDGCVLVNLTNGTPAQARDMAAWVADHGGSYVDGAIMVTPELIGRPEAFVFYSGAAGNYRPWEEALGVMGRPVHVGDDVALAALYDLALLSAMFGMFGGFLHAAALLRSQDIAVSDVAPMIGSLLTAMVELLPQIARDIDGGEHSLPSSNNVMMAAGLRNILDGSHEQGVRTDLLEPVWKLFDQGVDAGLGGHDIAALVPLLRRA